MLKHFSKDAKIKVNVEKPDGIIRGMTFTLEEYRDFAKNAYALMDEYEYERRDTIINVGADGQSGAVADQVFEKVITGGETIRSVTMETATFKMEDERVVIIALEGTLRREAPQRLRRS